MSKNTKIGIWVVVSLLLMFGFTTVAFGAAASKNPPTSEQRYDGPAMVGTVTVTYIDPDNQQALYIVKLNIAGKEKNVQGFADLAGFSEDQFRNADKSLFNDYSLPAYIAQLVCDCFDQLNIMTVMSWSHQETDLGPSITADVVLMRVVSKK
jgi:hypothetical protein